MAEFIAAVMLDMGLRLPPDLRRPSVLWRKTLDTGGDFIGGEGGFMGLVTVCGATLGRASCRPSSSLEQKEFCAEAVFSFHAIDPDSSSESGSNTLRSGSGRGLNLGANLPWGSGRPGVEGTCGLPLVTLLPLLAVPPLPRGT